MYMIHLEKVMKFIVLNVPMLLVLECLVTPLVGSNSLNLNLSWERQYLHYLLNKWLNLNK